MFISYERERCNQQDHREQGEQPKKKEIDECGNDHDDDDNVTGSNKPFVSLRNSLKSFSHSVCHSSFDINPVANR